MKIPPTSDLTLGKSVHSALEGNYRQKIESQQDLPLADVTDMFSDTWESQVQETVFETDGRPGEIKDEGIGLLKKYQSTIAPRIQPVHVEK